MNLSRYHTLVFDCDGVILDSNKIKTAAFYQAALPYGQPAAEALVRYHVANGGISRYKKFAFFMEHILNESAQTKSTSLAAIEDLLKHYAEAVAEGLMTCNVAEGLASLRRQSSHARWLVVSGGDQSELRNVFRQRHIDYLFDGGIFGSPDTKEEILSREIASSNIQQPALFIGDSHYDYAAAQQAGLDFVFLHDWSEWQPDAEWLQHEGIHSTGRLKDFIDDKN